MATYEAWLTDSPSSLTNRVVTVEATSEREAFAKAKALCSTDSEFVRGVTEVVPEAEVSARYEVI